jgi:hypothetical protein
MRNNSGIKWLLGLIAAVIVFHISVLAKIIPYHFVWGGRLQDDNEMYVFELASIVINLVLEAVLLMKGNFVKPLLSKKTINMTLWVFLVLFVLNTIGNLFAKTTFEKSFAVLTLIFALLIWSTLKNEPKIGHKKTPFLK